MNGTEWTEPGQGATCNELDEAVCNTENVVPYEVRRKVYDHLDRVNGTDPRGATRTNLRLTGAPLTAEDVANIGRCK